MPWMIKDVAGSYTGHCRLKSYDGQEFLADDSEDFLIYKQRIDDCVHNAGIKSALSEIDAKSIRSLRELMVSKFGTDDDFPHYLLDHESFAQAERSLLINND